MHSYEHRYSPVLARLLAPVASAYPGSARPYDCTSLPDPDFLEMGAVRCVTDSRTGRDFLQRHGDHGRREVTVDLFFKALKSGRRLANARSVNALLAPAMAARRADPFAAFPELDGFALFAADGHYHGAAVHDPVGTDSAGKPRKRATGHFLALNLRNHHLAHLAHAEIGGARKAEHDMHAIRRTAFDDLRGGTPAGTRVILVWDRAGIDFAFWQKAKKAAGLYFLSRGKENMNLMVGGNLPFDRKDARNAGVVFDELVSPASGGAMFRRVTYIDPLEGTRYAYLTTEMTPAAGAPRPPLQTALGHRTGAEGGDGRPVRFKYCRQKVFDELKSKLFERKSWASGATAKKMHAVFLCLAHNLLVLPGEEILREEAVDNRPERGRKEERREAAVRRGRTSSPRRSSASRCAA